LFELLLKMTDHKPDNIVVAYPEQEDCEIGHRPVQTFCDYCRSVKPVGDFADRTDFDAFTLRPWLGFIMVLDYLPAEEDFRYRVYGTRVADHSGFDMTGRRVSDFESPVGVFFNDLYRDCVTRKRLIYSEHTRVHGRFDCDWHRILCPALAGDSIQVVVCNYPIARQRPRGDDV
jgi:hypothetical protein